MEIVDQSAQLILLVRTIQFKQIRNNVQTELHMDIDHFSTETRCGADQFECKAGVCIFSNNNNCDGPCILSSWVNDGAEDCSDGSDEDATPDKGKLIHKLRYIIKLCYC